MVMQTTLSMATMICGLARNFFDFYGYFDARLAYIPAMFNV
jgi:hypothetical protein